MARLELPLPPLDGASRVDRRQVDLRRAAASRSSIGLPVRRRLREHERRAETGAAPRPSPEPRRGGVALGSRRPPPPPTRERAWSGSVAVERERGAGQRAARSPPRARASAQAAARRASRPPCRRSNASTSSPSASAALRRRARRERRDPSPDEPRELGALVAISGDELGDLPQRDPPLAGRAGASAPARRRLRGVLAVEDERIAEVVAVGDGEQPRPEVVVLALAERRVVAEPVRVEHLRSTSTVGWKNGDEKSAAQRTARAPAGIRWTRTDPPVVAEIDHPGPDDRRGRGASRMRATSRSSQAGSATSSASMRAT